MVVPSLQLIHLTRDRSLQGYNSGGTPIAIVGAVKGVAGAPVRGTVGVLELVSKSAHGVGLIFLGREAISGSVQRRIRAPGAFSHDDSLEVSRDAEARN